MCEYSGPGSLYAAPVVHFSSLINHVLIASREHSNLYAFTIKCLKIIRAVVYTLIGIMIPVLETSYEDWMSGESRDSGVNTADLSECLFGDTELLDVFGAERGGHAFLWKYSLEDVNRVIRNGPVGKKLENAGFGDWQVEFDLSDPFNHYLYIRSPRFKAKDQYVAFLIVRVDQPILKMSAHSPKGLEFLREHLNLNKWNLLNIQWLSLQNPGAKFTAERPRLPGQRYPGSGLGRSVFSELKRYCKAAKRDGIMNVPEHFHNAVMYHGFYFIDPYNQAIFNRMLLDLEPEIKAKSLAAVSWAVGTGALRLDNKEFSWNLGEQILPFTMMAVSYFNSCHYTDAVTECEMSLGKFQIVWEDVGRDLGNTNNLG